jgi:hypothetical protein
MQSQNDHIASKSELVQVSVLGIDIQGLPGKWVKVESRYDYANNKSRCPVCGSVGWVWAGWFSCDAGKTLDHVAVVETGDTYIRVGGREE